MTIAYYGHYVYCCQRAVEGAHMSTLYKVSVVPSARSHILIELALEWHIKGHLFRQETSQKPSKKPWLFSEKQSEETGNQDKVSTHPKWIFMSLHRIVVSRRTFSKSDRVRTGEWLKPQTSAQHFMELLVHPRDAGVDRIDEKWRLIC